MTNTNERILIEGGIDAYMAAANATTLELLASDNSMVSLLREYDIYLRENLWQGHQLSPLPLMLSMNAYQLFLAGSRMALSGHCAAVFPLLRTSLESAAYAGLMMHKPQLENVWIQRHGSEKENVACRKEFTFKKAVEPLKERAPDIYELALLVYENAIDYGAHPNIKGVLSHVTIGDQREDNCLAFSHASLYGTTHIETLRALCACLDFGFTIIGIITLSSPRDGNSLLADLNRLSAAKNEVTERYCPVPET